MRRLQFVVALAGSLWAAHVHAQEAAEPNAERGVELSAPAPDFVTPSDDELALARSLFQQGVGLAEQRKFGQAAQRFREALAIHSAPTVAYNLAAALFELGEYSEAFNLAERAQHDPEAPEALRARAEALCETLMPRTARLTVTASSTTGPEGLLVYIDDRLLDPAWMGVARAVAPGEHRVSTARKGVRISERVVDVPLRTSVIIDVSLIVAERTPKAEPLLQVQPASSLALRAHDDARRDDLDRKRRIRLWSGISAGIVAVGAGVALGLALRHDEPREPAASGDFMPGVLTWR